jgi:hypothetical protein
VYFMFFGWRDIFFFLAASFIFLLMVFVGKDYSGFNRSISTAWARSIFAPVDNPYCILGLLLLITAFYQGFFTDALVYGNELFVRANFAGWLLDGVDHPYAASIVSVHLGVPFFLAFFFVPIFCVLGDTIPAVFIGLVLIQLLTVSLMYTFGRRYFSRDVAIISTTLLAVRPAVLSRAYYYTDCGVQAETALFNLIILHLFFAIVFKQKTSPSERRFERTGIPRECVSALSRDARDYILCAFLGLMSGLSFFVCYTNALMVMALALFIVITRLYRTHWQFLLVYMATFCLGCMPIFMFTPSGLSVGTRTGFGAVPLYVLPFLKNTPMWYSLFFLCENIFEICGAPFIETAAVLFFPLYLYIVVFLGAVLSSAYCFCLWVVKICRMRSADERLVYARSALAKEAIFFLYFTVVIAANILHPQPWPAREYFFPAYLPLCFILALLIVKIQKGSVFFKVKIPRAFAYVLLSIVLLSVYMLSFGVFSLDKWNANWDLLWQSRNVKGRSTSLPIYTQADMFYSSFLEYAWHHQYGSGAGVILQNVKMLQSFRDIDHIYSFFKYEFYRSTFFDLAEIEHDHRNVVYMAIGSFFADGLHYENGNILRKINQDHAPAVAYHFNRGVAKSLCNQMFDDVEAYFQSGYIDRNVPREYRHYYYRVFGERIAKKYDDTRDGARMYMRTFAEEFHADLFAGYARRLSLDALFALLSDQSAVLSHRDRAACWKQVGRLKADAGNVWHFLETDVPIDYRGSFFSGFCVMTAENFLLHDYFQGFQFDLDSQLWRDKEIALLEHFQEFTAGHEEQAALIYQGLGELICDISLGEIPDDFSEHLQKQRSGELVQPFFKGYGRGLAQLFGNNRVFLNRYVKKYVPQEYQEAAYAGLDEYALSKP